MTSEQNQPMSTADAASILSRIGHLTRQLRDGLRELGLDRQVAMAAEAIPDARERLKYVANMTERAAERALNAVDIAQPVQEKLSAESKALNALWSKWQAEPTRLGVDSQLVTQTRAYLDSVPAQASAINAQLLEIMMAQDFQDLTGQVIKKMMDVINEVETQLLQVLIDHAPKGTFPESDGGLQNGPQIKAGQGSAVSGQAQVDDLLESLGF